MLNDRQVHATLADGSEVVRYDRAGKWYLERKGQRYRKLSLGTAAELARSPGATVRLGMPGGGRFDAAMRA